MTAAERWAEQLAAWAVPEEILAAAPESPWGFPPGLFAAVDDGPPTPSWRRALEALGSGGTVLDVGVGAGAASLPLAPLATEIVGVDESPKMLDAFAAAAEERGVRHQEILGRWPDVADSAPEADVVVCHHVFYNVPDLDQFALALDAHAGRQVVVELTAVHPQVSLAHLWLRFHGLERPTGPAVEDAVAVLAEAGIDAQVERFERAPSWATRHPSERVAFVRRRLCLPPEREPEVDEVLGNAELAPRAAATLWWDVGR